MELERVLFRGGRRRVACGTMADSICRICVSRRCLCGRCAASAALDDAYVPRRDAYSASNAPLLIHFHVKGAAHVAHQRQGFQLSRATRCSQEARRGPPFCKPSSRHILRRRRRRLSEDGKALRMPAEIIISDPNSAFFGG